MVKPKETAQRAQTIPLQNVWDTLNTGHRKWRSGDPRNWGPKDWGAEDPESWWLVALGRCDKNNVTNYKQLVLKFEAQTQGCVVAKQLLNLLVGPILVSLKLSLK